MVAESAHRAGQEGVIEAKHFLDCTTYINITFTVYDDEMRTTLVGLGNIRKVYDLTGFFLGEDRRPLFVEVKNYNFVGTQPAEFTEFLANAYSITALGQQQDLDRRYEFMWFTWHPFSQSKWANLTSEAEIRSALAAHPNALGDSEIDESVVRLTAERLWLVPMHRRHSELLMSREELLLVHGSLGRKGLI